MQTNCGGVQTRKILLSLGGDEKSGDGRFVNMMKKYEGNVFMQLEWTDSVRPRFFYFIQINYYLPRWRNHWPVRKHGKDLSVPQWLRLLGLKKGTDKNVYISR